MLEALGLEGCSETKTALENALHDRRGQFLAVGEDAMPPTMLTMIALRKNDLALVHRELLVPASNPLVEALQLLERETPHLDSVLDLLCGQPPCHEGPERSEEHTSELQSLIRISYAVFC